jgi:hypothetical protein
LAKYRLTEEGSATMNISYQKALLHFQNGCNYNLDKEPGSSVSFMNYPESVCILLFTNRNTLTLQALVHYDQIIFCDYSSKNFNLSKEQFFEKLKNHPAHFEWFLFNF